MASASLLFSLLVNMRILMIRRCGLPGQGETGMGKVGDQRIERRCRNGGCITGYVTVSGLGSAQNYIPRILSLQDIGGDDTSRVFGGLWLGLVVRN